MSTSAKLLRDRSYIDSTLTSTETHSPHINVLLKESRNLNALYIASPLSERIRIEELCPYSLNHLLGNHDLRENTTFKERHSRHGLGLKPNRSERLICEKLLSDNVWARPPMH
jgi:hypothetical protein